MDQAEGHLGLKKTASTLIVVVCLGMQASTFVTGTKVWPFMAYCMYAYSWGEPVTSRQRKVVAVFDDGSTQTVNPKTIGVNSFIWERHYIREMTSGEPGAVRKTADRIERFTDLKVVRIELHTDVHQIIDQTHVVNQEIEVLGELPEEGETP